MLKVTIKSYDSLFDTFEVEIHPFDMMGRLCADDHKVKSLIPAIMMPYVAPDLVANTEDLPFDLVDKEFTMKWPLLD